MTKRDINRLTLDTLTGKLTLGRAPRGPLSTVSTVSVENVEMSLSSNPVVDRAVHFPLYLPGSSFVT